MIRFTLIAVALALAGCSKADLASLDPTIPLAQLSIVSDNYCSLAKKRGWSVNDTRRTIDDARRENHKWDCLCTSMKGKPECSAYQNATS